MTNTSTRVVRKGGGGKGFEMPTLQSIPVYVDLPVPILYEGPEL